MQCQQILKLQAILLLVDQDLWERWGNWSVPAALHLCEAGRLLDEAMESQNSWRWTQRSGPGECHQSSLKHSISCETLMTHWKTWRNASWSHFRFACIDSQQPDPSRDLFPFIFCQVHTHPTITTQLCSAKFCSPRPIFFYKSILPTPVAIQPILQVPKKTLALSYLNSCCSSRLPLPLHSP